MQRVELDVIIVGGGAAGYFAAVNIAEMNPELRIAILERSKNVLSKVKISGGGRCNVTHAEYDPHELIRNYPRGEKELLGPFHKFMTGDVIAWFEERDVALKTEPDGRIFPVSDNSQTILDCLTQKATELGVQQWTQQGVNDISKMANGWTVVTKSHQFVARYVLICTGSDNRMWNILAKLGHTIVPAVPSLFTFNIQDKRIVDLPGVAHEATVSVLHMSLVSTGPLLITHWGMSGPAILKLSAWGARILAEQDYRFEIRVNWTNGLSSQTVVDQLKEVKVASGKFNVFGHVQFGLPRRLWGNLVVAAGIEPGMKWGDLRRIQIQNLAEQLTEGVFKVNGKSTFKEEFVTAGGVDLREISFKSFQSKLHPNLYLAGEVLDIDAITGGFNFQSAWTGAFLAAQSIAESG